MLTKTLLALSLLTGTIVATNLIQSVNTQNKIDSFSTIAQLPTADVENIARNITVQIKVGQDKGSGILVNKDNNTYTVITNAGVTDRGDSYTIVTSEGIEHQATLVNSNTDKSDLAVLEFNSNNTYSVATIGNSNSITEGEAVIAAGFPENKNDISITNGTITHVTEKPLNKGYSIGFNNETVQGMSGGVLLNSNGEVIAVLGKGNAILDTAYNYSDGTLPTAEQIEQYRQYSFSIPIANIALISPQLAALIPDNTNQPGIAQQPKATPTPKQTEYKGIVKTVDDIAQQITVRIATAELDSYGSGVIIAKDGNTYYVATVAHNFPEGAINSYQVVTNDGESHQLDLNTVKKSDAYDFAVFSFTSDKEYTVATIGNYTVAANRSQVVFTSGFPGMYAPTRIITGGEVSKQDTTSFKTKDSSTFLGTTTDTPGLLYTNLSYKGMSGGAVLDGEGRLIGINTGAENELYFDEEGNDSEIGLGYSLGVPISDVLTFIDRDTELKTEWLQTTSNSAAKLSDNDLRSIEEQLLATEAPKDETDLAAWMNYGNWLWRYGRSNEAVAAFEKVIAINPDYDRAYYAMGLAHRYQQDYNRAVASLLKATQLNPKPYFYWRYLGSSYWKLKQYDLAIAAYKKAIEKNAEDFVLYVEYGDVNRENQDYEDAVFSYNKAIALNPNHPWAYLNRGGVYKEQGKLELALSDYNKALEIDPNDGKAYNNRGLVYSDRGKFDLALSDYNKAIEINPQFAEAYNNRGLVYYEQGKIELALSDYNKALEINPQFADAYINRGVVYTQQGKLELALSDYSKAIEINPQYVNAYIGRGVVYSERGKWDLALSDYSKAIEINPQLALAYSNRGNVYSERGNIELALSDYNKALEINPNDAIAYYNRGAVYKEQGKFDLALSDYNKAIEINPQFADAYYNRGLFYYDRGKLDKAISDYNKALEINPQYANAYYNRGVVYTQQGKIELALSDYSKALEINPQYVNAYINRGVVYTQQGKLELALSDYSKAIEINPQLAEAYINRGVVYDNQGKLDKAISDYNKAIEINPNDADAYYNRALVYYEQGKLDKAISDYNKALEINPQWAEAYYNRGLFYSEQGKLEKALSDYSKAIEINPQWAEAYYNRGFVYYDRGNIEQAKIDFQKAYQLFVAQGNTAGANQVANVLQRLP